MEGKLKKRLILIILIALQSLPFFFGQTKENLLPKPLLANYNLKTSFHFAKSSQEKIRQWLKALCEAESKKRKKTS